VALRQSELPAAKAAFQEALSASRACSLAHAGLGHVARAAWAATPRPRPATTSRRPARSPPATPPVDEAQFFHQEGVRYQGLASRSKKPEYFRQARQCFARAMAKDLLGSLPALERARLAAEWSSFDVAVTLADRAVQGDPTLRDAYELLGFLYARDLPTQRDEKTGRPDKLRDPARAQKIFDEAIAVARTPEDAADARYGRALPSWPWPGRAPGPRTPRVVSAREDLLAASRTIPKNFREALPRRISQAIAYLELLADVSKQLGAVDGEKEAREQVAEVRKAAEEAAKAELREGQTLRDRLNYSEAIKRFDRAIELYPEFSAAYYERGTCYLKIGNFVPGILDFSRALELDPRIADQVYNKVYQISYVVDLNRVITELNKIVSDHPNVSYVIFLRGFFYVAKTEFKKFEREDLDRASPTSTAAWSSTPSTSRRCSTAASCSTRWPASSRRRTSRGARPATTRPWPTTPPR
jgi:tetratricopeptide (TPR) repeat protein